MMDWSNLPDSLAESLLPFQKEGVRFAVEKNGRCLIADEMGLGKTLQAISVARVYQDDWPLLIIVPSSLKFCWIEEIEKWLPDILPHEINLIRSGSDASAIADSPISIITYGLLRLPSAKLVREAITRRKFQVIICDESHYLRNTQTLSSKTIVPIIKSAKRRILLSGTPALARPVELFPQLDAVCPGRFGTFWQFTERYCAPRMMHFGRMRRRNVDGASNLEELQQRMSSMLMIRREKDKVLTELPAKQRQRVLFELKDSNLKKEILERFETLRRNIHKGSKMFQQLMKDVPNSHVDESVVSDGLSQGQQQQEDSVSVFKDISTLYRMSGEAKTGPVKEYIEMLCENENLKFLVFAYHHNMMDGIEQSLYAKKIKFMRIDGHTKGIDRQANVTQFQSDPSTRVAILSILAAGVGLTLTSAKLVVFAELYWTPGVMIQCEDRAHRIGQTNGLSVHYLVAKNTMDEWVWASVCKKTIVTTTALSGKCKQLEHDEGHDYQIEVLSKADVWTPQTEEIENVDVVDLMKSQRPPDQPSILDFISSPRQRIGDKSNVGSGKKYKDEKNVIGVKRSIIGSHLTRSRNPRFASPVTKMKFINENLSDVVTILDSDEEGEFKPAKKKRKQNQSSSREEELKPAKKKRKQTESSTRERLLRKLNQGTATVTNQMESEGCSNSQYDQKINTERCKIIQKKDENKMCLSDSDDIFSDGSSDSLPDIYAESNKGKIKQKGLSGDTSQKDGTLKSDLTAVESESVGNEINTEIKGNDLHEENFDPKFQHETINSVTQDNLCNGEVQNENRLDDKKHLETVNTSNKEGSLLNEETMKSWSCSVCTFLNHQDLGLCEICDTPKKRKTRRSTLHVGGELNTSSDGPSVSCISEPLVSSVDSSLKKGGVKNGIVNSMTSMKSDNVTSTNSASDAMLVFNEKSEECKSNQDTMTVDNKSVSRTEISSFGSDCDENVDCDGAIEEDDVGSNCDLFSCDDSDEGGDELCHAKSPKLMQTTNNASTVTCTDLSKITPNDSTSSLVSFPSSQSSSTTISESSIHCAMSSSPSLCSAATSSSSSIYHKSFKFSCSNNTGRIYVYDEKGVSLKANFQPVEVEIGNTDGLPLILRHPEHLRLLQRIVREWMSLSATKRRLIAKQGLIFERPLQAYESVKSVHGSTQRHLIKDSLAKASEKAQSIQGHVRLIAQRSPTKSVSTGEGEASGQGTAQVVTSDGIPLCLQCQKPYTNPLLPSSVVSKPENAWQLRLCSHACMDKYWTLKHASYCREQMYEIEKGVCTLCHFNAHGFYNQMKSTKDVRKRAEMVRQSTYSKLGSKAREKLVTQVLQGQFWHVDHIIPVYKGGGLCDLDNLRTLCTPCHMKVTKEQAGHRANVRKLSSAVSGGDIAAFFKKS